MMNYNKFRRMLITPVVMAVSGLMMLTGCTTVDDTLGSNLVPDNQQMTAGYLSLPKLSELNPKRYVETRLYQTDSIVSSNLSYGYFGSTLDDTVGLRSAGFLSQYLNYYKVDSGYFGFLPLFDSAQLLLSIKGYGQDTVTPQKYYVYEITDNKYLTEKTDGDTTFYLSFDPEKAGIVSQQPLFSFTFPAEGMEAPTKTTAVTLTVEGDSRSGGAEFIDRLMLKKDNSQTKAGDYSIYSLDSLKQWVEAFKGLYIRPATDQTQMGKGGLYAMALEASGLSVFGRNRVKEDPSLIKDTIGMVYYFYDAYTKSGFGNVSINTLHRDYDMATSAAKINIADAREPKEGQPDNRPLNSLIYVEGMAGVTSELTFTQDFFDALDKALAEQNDKAGTDFKTVAFSQARMSIYFSGSNYDWTQIDPTNPGKLIQEMNAAQSRLGLYTNLKKMTPITDYAYSYETDYGGTIAYGGYINRSRGCYVMDITGYAQALWNNYAKERDAAKAEGRAIDLKNVKLRTLYLGPDAYSFFTSAYTVAQGMADGEGSTAENNAPIRFDLTYNMIK